MSNQSLRILVVDDEPDIRQLVSEILEDEAIKSVWLKMPVWRKC